MNAICPLLLAVAAALVTRNALAEEPPKNWRFPVDAELQDEERSESPTRYVRAEADYNGDGVPDVASILVDTATAREALWVLLSQPGGGRTWVRLNEMTWPRESNHPLITMAVETQKPGVVSYACFDTSPDCNFAPSQGRPKLRLRDPSIMYFKFGSAASLFFWSHRYQRFLRVWLSD